MINVVVRGKTFTAAMESAGDLAELTASLAPRDAFAVLGPAPAPLTRLKGEHRAQFFLKGRTRRAMRDALTQAMSRMPELTRRTVVDVDPLNVL